MQKPRCLPSPGPHLSPSQLEPPGSQLEPPRVCVEVDPLQRQIVPLDFHCNEVLVPICYKHRGAEPGPRMRKATKEKRPAHENMGQVTCYNRATTLHCAKKVRGSSLLPKRCTFDFVTLISPASSPVRVLLLPAWHPLDIIQGSLLLFLSTVSDI